MLGKCLCELTGCSLLFGPEISPMYKERPSDKQELMYFLSSVCVCFEPGGYLAKDRDDPVVLLEEKHVSFVSTNLRAAFHSPERV